MKTRPDDSRPPQRDEFTENSQLFALNHGSCLKRALIQIEISQLELFSVLRNITLDTITNSVTTIYYHGLIPFFFIHIFINKFGVIPGFFLELPSRFKRISLRNVLTFVGLE